MTLPAPDPAFHWTSETWGNALRCRPLAEATQHLFTSKQLALPDAGAWRAALGSVGSSPDRLMRVKQVHGNVVRILNRGHVPDDAAAIRPDGDAIISSLAGQALAVMVADCVPILLAARRGAAAAIHAGWRGTCARIAFTAVEAMIREFGTDPAEIIAAIGPSAGPADYEVGESLVTAFLDAGHPRTAVYLWFTTGRGPKPHLDLWAANTEMLIDAGLQPDRIFVCGLSTVSHPDVFDSYRVDGERAGRMAGIIVVPPPG